MSKRELSPLTAAVVAGLSLTGAADQIGMPGEADAGDQRMMLAMMLVPRRPLSLAWVGCRVMMRATLGGRSAALTMPPGSLPLYPQPL
ncbi:hypothetical protein HPB50_010234 [Hyalomma asiaticum]|uniref:Uncharacterized protein n=1 Tax=Hyalomma asiaticum TaxID=266040 RepID=A0ACB7SE46_HYAAI|nr:hypothetical protein HPB50_010234 [Hyalomma asiaticum]